MIDKLKAKQAKLLKQQEALLLEQKKIKSALRKQFEKKRNGQLIVLGLVLDNILRRFPETTQNISIENILTREIDKKRYEEALELIKKNFPLGTDTQDSHSD